jgi:transposase
MASVRSLSVLDHLPAWRLRLLGEDFISAPWHDLHPDRLAIEADLSEPLLRLARAIDRFVDRLCLAELVASFTGRGSSAHRPDLMLKAVLFFLQRGLQSPADWFIACRDSRAAAWLLRGLRPSRARWYAFRKRCAGLIDSLNQQLLQQAISAGLLDVDVSVFDGTFLAANSSRHVLLNHKQLQRRLQQLEQAIAAELVAPAAFAPRVEASAKLSGTVAEAGGELARAACEAPGNSPSEASQQRPVEPAFVSANVTAQPVVAGAIEPMACATVAALAGPVCLARQSSAAPPLDEVVSGPVGQPPAKPPGWMARTVKGRQRQREHYLKVVKELGKQLERNRKRRKEDRKEEDKVRISLGDPEATLGLDKEKVYRPVYNEQLVSDLETDFCLGYDVFSGVQDAATLKAMRQRVEYFTAKKVKRGMMDAGYVTGANLREAESAKMELIAPYQENDYSQKKAAGKAKKQIGKSEFKWDEQKQTYICPEGRELSYVRTQTKQRGENKEKHKQYRCPGQYCQQCPRQNECTKNPQAGRMVVRGEYEEEVQRHKARMSSEQAKQLYKKRKEQIERRIADSKEHRDLRKLSMRGQDGARTQVGLTVLAANIMVYDKLERAAAKVDVLPPHLPDKVSTLPPHLL